MPRKKNKKKKAKKEKEIIIGYNSKGKKDKPSKRENKRKRRNRIKKIKRILWLIFKIILVIAVIMGIGMFLFVSPVFNITKINVENANKISQNTYIALSEIEIGENIFRINKSKIEENIRKESYVEEVEIKREFPGTIWIITKERTPAYMIEQNGGQYAYTDKNGYILEITTNKIDLPIIKRTKTDIEKINPGDRIGEEELERFNDLIKIADGIKNNEIDVKISSFDISEKNNYILEFEEQNKKAILGDTSNLSTKMLWIKYFIEKKKDEKGTIHLKDISNVYFAPEE